VSPRELRAALDAYDHWHGDLASIIVPKPKEWVTGEAPRIGDPIGEWYVEAPLGEDGAEDFISFVDFLRSSEPDGVFVDN